MNNYCRPTHQYTTFLNPRKVMEILTSWMQKGFEQGREEGFKLGLEEGIENLALLDFTSITDLENWLTRV